MSRRRVPLSANARSILRAVVSAGAAGSSTSDLLGLVNGSWHRLLGAVSVLDRRHFVRLRTDRVLPMSSGVDAVRGGI